MNEKKSKIGQVFDTKMTLVQIVDHAENKRALLPEFCVRRGRDLPIALTGFVFEDSGEKRILFPVLRNIA